MFFSSLLALLPTSIFNLPGSAALIIIILYICFGFVIKMIKVQKNKKYSNDDLRIEIVKISESLKLALAHYESEQRFRQDLEIRILRIEKAVGSGNGDKPLATRVALVEQDLINIKEKI